MLMDRMTMGLAMFKGIILAVVAILACSAQSGQTQGLAGLSAETSSVVRACSAWFATRSSASGPAVLARSPNAICFDGAIDPAGSAALTAALKAIPADKPVLLVVRSGGGGISESLDVAEAIAGRDVTVMVHTLCGSGCANCIFLPARKRIILDDAVVAFHGGASLTLARKFEDDRAKFIASNPGVDFDRLARDWRTRLERDVARQDAILRTAGVDRDFFAWFDRMASEPPSGQSADCAANAEAEAIVFSEDFLRQRGVVIAYNGGPRSAEGLQRINMKRGWGRHSCFWS